MIVTQPWFYYHILLLQLARFCLNHDKLFDDNGYIMISDELDLNDRIFMNIRDDMKMLFRRRIKDILNIIGLTF